MNNTMDPNTDEAKTDEAKTDKNLWLNSTFNSFNQQGEWMVDRFFIPTEKSVVTFYVEELLHDQVVKMKSLILSDDI